jgi:Carboxypeptidase regulatory-like domain
MMNTKQRSGSFKVFAIITGLVALLAMSLCVPPAFADNLYGSIRGTVTDASGAALPGVQLKLTNVDTGIAKELAAGGDGSFQFIELQPGKYALSATKANFKMFEARGIEIIQNQIYVQSIKMEVGAASETLEVTANQAQVETTSIQLGATLSGEMVQDLPTLNRNWITLQQTLPGVVAPDTRFGNNYATNGSQAQQNSYLINGNDANDLPLNSPLVQPNPDAIAEVQMVTNTINPEFGRNSGAILNATTKSGTNNFHGSAFEFYRDTFLNTAAFGQGGTVPKIHQNQYGGTVGGPIWKNKLFFFYSLQNTRASQPIAQQAQKVFTQAQLGGDWSGSTLSSKPIPGQLAGIVTGPGGSGAGGTCTAAQTWAQCFPTGQVPTSDYSTLSTTLVGQFVPLPNTNGDEYGFGPISRVKINQHIGRMDLTISQKDSVWFNAIANDQTTANDLPFSGATLPGFGDGSIPYTKYFNADWIHTFSGATLNEFRVGYTRLNFPSGQPQHVRQPAAVGFPNIFPQLASGADYPQMSISGYFTLGGTNNGPQPRKDQTYQLTDNFSWVKGKHSIKMGYDGRKFQVWNPFANSNEGAFTFSQAATYSTGDAGLDFLLGIPNGFSQGSGSVIIADAYEHYFYLQDQWRVKNNLTLTIGTGYQIDTPITEYQNGGLSRACFQAGVQSTVFATAPVGLTYPGDPGCNKQGGPTTKYNHIGPRVGFAWSPDIGGGTGKTSIRGGLGLYFNRTEEELNLQDLSTPPFGLTSNGATFPSFPNPYVDLNSGAVTANQFPYVPPGKGASPNFAALYPDGFGFIFNNNPKNLTVPHTINWNLTLQRELPSQIIFSIGYVGAHGSGLITSYTENPATPAGVANCLATPACVANGPVEPILYPGNYQYPGNIWGNFGQITNAGYSNYNALQATLTKHITHGLEFQTSYTWSHSLDISSSFEDTAFHLAGGVSNYGPNRARDYGNSAFDARNRWVADFVYQTPQFAKRWGRIADSLIDGWVFTGINTLQSGDPIEFQDSDLRSLSCTYLLSYYGCSDRPDVVTRPTKLDPHLPGNLWFNPASFTDNAIGTEGSTPRGYFNGPGLWNTDFTVRKDFKVTEGSHFQTEIDFFNLFNHTNFGAPVADFGAGSVFGVIQGIRANTNSRLIQLGGKFVF